jgi:2-keto-4-pentenoate hydratase/2-oxohepta-3-ene-1,7-dioic acid hydratase in catechol pathway
MTHLIVRFQVPDQPPRYGTLQADQSVAVLNSSPWLGGRPTGEYVEDFTLLAPCLPGKILCVGKNYRDHAAEMAGLSSDGSVQVGDQISVEIAGIGILENSVGSVL